MMDINNKSTITLDSTGESRITDVILYNDRAQITRLYKLASVSAGKTELKMTNLPNVVERDSVRVEFRSGSAVVRDVMASQNPKMPYKEMSPVLQRLEDQEAKASSAQARCQTEFDLIQARMHNQINQVDISELNETLNTYNRLQASRKGALIEGKSKLARLDQEIQDEKSRLREIRAKADRLRTVVTVGVYAVDPTELEIVLTYVVSGASWEPAYDLYVDMENRAPNAPAPVNFIYRAHIKQDTGEDWENVSLTFKTAQHLLGEDGCVPLPSLWTVKHKSLDTSSPAPHSSTPVQSTPFQSTPVQSTPVAAPSFVESAEEREAPRDSFSPKPMGSTVIWNADTTIPIPKLSTVTTMKTKHYMTIAELELEAKVALGSTNPYDTRAQIMASITNLSGYMLLPGIGNVYLGQDFVYRVHIPFVRPKEVFTCMLGFDPSIRITYNWEETTVKSGFFKKKFVHIFTRRIFIHNKQDTPVHGFRMTTSFQTSKDEDITVALISPPLVLPSALHSTGTGTPKDKCGDKGSSSLAHAAKIEVSEGVTAMWKGTDQFWWPKAVDREDLGKDGVIDWLCDIPALGVTELLLEWKVTTTRPKEEFHWL